MRYIFLTLVLVLAPMVTQANEYERKLEYFARELIKSKLVNPEDAKFSEIRLNGLVFCGRVSASNGVGGRVSHRFMTNAIDFAVLEQQMTPVDFEYVWKEKCVK